MLFFVHTVLNSLYYSRNVDIIKYTSPIKISHFANTFHPNRKEKEKKLVMLTDNRSYIFVFFCL